MTELAADEGRGFRVLGFEVLLPVPTACAKKSRGVSYFVSPGRLTGQKFLKVTGTASMFYGNTGLMLL